MITKFLYFMSMFIILWAMIGYPIFLKVIYKIIKPKKIQKNYNYCPTVTVMVVAHNEEKVILEKLNNIINLDYPTNKLKFLIASDNSTDDTNNIVERFILQYPEKNISLFKVTKRKGKTNAQNEAQKVVDTEILVMTDANAILDTKAIRELASYFIDEKVAYVTGCLRYINDTQFDTAKSESTYWNLDLKMRYIESEIQTITAGNGALYACRNKEYYDFNPIQCHDSAMPIYYAIHNKRALFNPDAIAYEKAGENNIDEFNRKVRMNREILSSILPNIKILNIFKYKWFTIFYLGHRTCRYLLWISHLVLMLSNILLLNLSMLCKITFLVQVIFYVLAIIKYVTKKDNKYLNMIYYYMLTIVAQCLGVYNICTGKAKPFWEKAESTR